MKKYDFKSLIRKLSVVYDEVISSSYFKNNDLKSFKMQQRIVMIDEFLSLISHLSFRRFEDLATFSRLL